jgi:hypothetical protein
MGDRGYLGHLADLLAEALYAQGRLDEAQQMTEEAEVTGGQARSPGDLAVNKGESARPTRPFPGCRAAPR